MNWLNKKVVFVTGKGGTGKSTLCMALAMKARDAGMRPLLVETDILGIFGQLSGKTVEHEVSIIMPGIWACKIDFLKALRDYISIYIPAAKIVELILRNRIIKSFLSATPSAKELVIMSRIQQMINVKLPGVKKRPDIVIVDMPASGHAVMLLKTPKATIHLIPKGPLSKRADEIDKYFAKSGESGIIIIALPEELAVKEAIETNEKITKETGYPILNMVMNFSANGSKRINPQGPLDKMKITRDLSPEMKEALQIADTEFLRRHTRNRYEEQLASAVSEPLLRFGEIIDEGELGGLDIARKMSVLI